MSKKYATRAILSTSNPPEEISASEQQLIAEATALRQQLIEFEHKLRQLDYESPVTRMRNAVENLSEVIRDFGGAYLPQDPRS